MGIPAELVKQLREKTGVGFMECKSALEEAKGDVETAIIILRKRGLSASAKKAGRETKEGLIGTYVHHGELGAMVEVNCETDFVARNAEFQNLVKDIAMHIAASDPRFIRREDVTEELLARERESYKEQARAEGKPENILDKIVEGRVSKFYSETCLLDIQVRRFVRYKVGE